MAISFRLIIILSFLFLFNSYNINKNKWTSIFIMFFALLLFIPSDLQGLISGIDYGQQGYFNITMAGYDSLMILLLSIIQNIKIKSHNIKKVIVIIVLLSLLLLTRLLFDGFGAASNKLFDNYFLPVIMSVFALLFLSKDDIIKILKCVYIFIIVNAIVACLEFFVGKSLLFHNYLYENINWYKTIYYSTFYNIPFRSVAFLGHPLTNGIYYVLAFIYLINNDNLKFKFTNIIQYIILLFAIYTTNSRWDIICLVIYLMYYFIKNKKFFLLFLVTIISFIFLLNIDVMSIYYNIFSRDANNSSINVRVLAISSILKSPVKVLLFGTGYNNAQSLLSSMGFTANFEISYFIILIENGIFAFLIWISMMFVMINNKNKKSSVYSLIVKNMLVMFLLLIAASNSIGDPGSLNYILWILISFYSVLINENDESSGELYNGK